VELGTITPPATGFWDLGGFPADIQNPWRFGTKMAPFDQEVYSLAFIKQMFLSSYNAIKRFLYVVLYDY
jgi:hypothetical protein